MKHLRWLCYDASLTSIWPVLTCHMYLQRVPSSSQQAKLSHLESRTCANPCLPDRTDSVSEPLSVLWLSFAHLSGRIAVKTHVRQQRTSAQWDDITWFKPPRRYHCKAVHVAFVWSSCCFLWGPNRIVFCMNHLDERPRRRGKEHKAPDVNFNYNPV